MSLTCSFSVRHRPHNVLLSLTHHAPACIDEVYPIVIEVTNADNRELEVTMDILLQPTEVDDAGMHACNWSLEMTDTIVQSIR